MIDTSIRFDHRTCEYSSVINFYVNDKETLTFQPIGHVIVQKIHQEAIEIALEWYQKEFKEFFLPKIFATDFSSEVKLALQAAYPKTQTFLVHFDYTRYIWKQIFDAELVNNWEIHPAVFKLASFMKQLAFLSANEVKGQIKLYRNDKQFDFGKLKLEENFHSFLDKFEQECCSTYELLETWNQYS